MDPEAVVLHRRSRLQRGCNAAAALLAVVGLLEPGPGVAQPVAGWDDVALRASRIETPGVATLPAVPRWRADPMNVFVVIEAGDDHVSLVDGDRFDVLHRFPSRPVHGGPAFAPDGRHVYLASRDGWITKYDIWNLTVVAEVRAGIELSDLAVSGDGLWVMAANASPRTLALFDPELRLVRTYAVRTLDGRIDSRAAFVYDAAPRRSFIVTMRDMPEIWEISYDVRAEPIFDGLVHDYRMGEGIAKPGFLGVRRVPLEEPIESLLFEPGYRSAIGAGPTSIPGRSRGRVVNFDVRRVIATIPAPDVPRLEAGVGFASNAAAVLAFPSLERAVVTVVDTKTWRVVKTVPVAGAGSYLSSHELSPHAWVGSRSDASSSGSITLIDKKSLTTVGEVREPGGALSHVEFSRDGRYALASLQGSSGAIVVFDARTLEVVKHLPMRNPAGIYNVRNRIGDAGRNLVR